MLRSAAPAVPQGAAEAVEAGWQPSEPTYICTSVTADTVEGQLAEIAEATAAGVDIIELRLDYIKEFNPETDLQRLMGACSVPYIVTYRPTWEGCAARRARARCAGRCRRRGPHTRSSQPAACTSLTGLTLPRCGNGRRWGCARLSSHRRHQSHPSQQDCAPFPTHRRQSPTPPCPPPRHAPSPPCSGNYEGDEALRLAVLKWAALQGAPYVDVEYKAAHLFFAGGAAAGVRRIHVLYAVCMRCDCAQCIDVCICRRSGGLW